MAVRKNSGKARTAKALAEDFGAETETIGHLAPASKKRDVKKGNFKLVAAGLLVLTVLAGFWYKTGSWPIVAMAGGKMVTRYEINKELYAQYGKEAVENKITEVLVRKELDKTGIKVDESEITVKIDEIKASLGEGADLDTLLAERGMTQAEFRDQLSLQLRVEKALLQRVEVTDEEISQYVETNGQFMNATGEAAVVQAREAIKYNKLQEEVATWIEEIKTGNKVWRAPGV